jgi:dTDP-4-dehydrorhamnose reductase
MSENTQNTIFLFGHTGMLGRYVYSYFHQKNYKIIPIHYRVSKQTIDTLEDVLLEKGISENACVINCIGLIPQRKDKTVSDSEYYLINGLFPHILWNICKKYNVKMIQPTTDCVFSGKKGNYIETDTHDETNSYGTSKSLGEPLECTLIRTSIIGRELANKKSFMEWVFTNDGNVITGYTNHMWNGVTCLEYCKIIEKIILENLFWRGVRHIYSPTSKSKYELANMIKDVFNLNIHVHALECNETVDKTLTSIHDNIFDISELYNQISELKDFILIE